jgi:hypothetical protein
MLKNIIKSILIALLLVTSAQFYSIQNTEASSGISSSTKKFSGGKISSEPSKKITQKKRTCESGGTCNGTCSNTWKDLTKTTCGKGTFTLQVYSPKTAATEYCVPNSAKGNGTISSNKLIIDAYTQETSTKIGTCTCVSGEECEETTTETVSENLAQVTLFGVSGNSLSVFGGGSFGGGGAGGSF